MTEQTIWSLHAHVLEGMAEGVRVTNERGVIVYTNPAEDRMYGYERGELVGKPGTILEVDPRETAFQRDSTGVWAGERQNRRKDGTIFRTRVRISTIEVAGETLQICVEEDIGDDRSDVESYEAVEKLQALIGASPLPIISFDRNGLITLWNPAAERVFGWSQEEVLGKELPFIPEERLNEHRAMRQRDLAGQGFTAREVRRCRKDGTPIDISVSTAPVHDASGQITGIMSIYVDVTAQKKTTDEQQRSLEMLRLSENQLMLLVEASSALLASPQSAQVVLTILQLAQQFIQAEAYAVWRKVGPEWKLIASTGLSPNYHRSILPAPGGAPTMPGEPVPVEDVEESSLTRHRTHLYRAEGIVSLLTVPLAIRGEIAGSIVFYYRSRHRFTDAELRVAGALGNLAASALQTAELYEREAELRRLAQMAERRASFLAQVGEVLASSLDYKVTLAHVARLAIPDLADWCAVDLVEENGALRRLAVEHVDPGKIDFAYSYSKRYPPCQDDLIHVALRTGRSVLKPVVSDAELVQRARDAEHLTMMRRLGLRSVICAPMLIRGHAFGVLTFVTSESERTYGPSDLEMAEEIARHAAVAIENARLFKEVRENEERFRRLYDSNMVGVAFWNTEGLITAANDAALALIGFTREELERDGKVSWLPRTPDEFRWVDQQILEECRATGGSGMYEKEYLHTDGKRFTVLIAAAFLTSSRHDGVAFILDITDRKRLERQFRGVADAAIAINTAGSVDEILRIVSECASSLIGSPAADASLDITVRDVPTPGALTAPLKDRNELHVGIIQVAEKPSGGFTESDRVILAQLAETASVAIENAELTASLRRSNEDLRRANEDLNQFAYSASHDLREPLRMIAVYTQMLARKCGTQLDEEANLFMRYTLDGAQRLEMLLRDLLAYTHAINIRGYPSEPVSSAGALQKALANLQTAIAGSNASITIDDLPPVRAYEVHVVQLFQNLVGNALKYRGAADPVIAIGARPHADPGFWVFTVRDNAIGISPKYHKQVFGLFKRLYSAHEYPGTGIGLAICQRVVERYGGRIWVESEEGRGSTFFFTLPV